MCSANFQVLTIQFFAFSQNLYDVNFNPANRNTVLCAVFFNFKGVLVLLKVSQTVKKILNSCSFARLFLAEIVFRSLFRTLNVKQESQISSFGKVSAVF